MSQKDTWTHIRVRKATLARLREVARRLVQLHEQGLVTVDEIDPEPKNPLACGLSDDALINRLLDDRDAHNRRAREQRTRRRRERSSGEDRQEDGQDT